MEPIVAKLLVLAINITLLTLGSWAFVKGAIIAGRRFNLSPIGVGIIIAVGTSLPELITSIMAVITGASDVVAGNVIGSNMTNWCFAFVVVIWRFKEFHITHDVFKISIPVLFGSSLFVLYCAMYGFISWWLALIGFAIGIYYVVSSAKDFDIEEDKDVAQRPTTPRFIFGLALILFGTGLLWFTPEYVVSSAIDSAELLGWKREAASVVFIAMGTSLPELVSSLFAVKEKGGPDMVIGNIFGSCVFNAFVVMTVPRMFGPVSIPETMQDLSYFLVGVTVLISYILYDKKVNTVEKLLLSGAFILFLGWLSR